MSMILALDKITFIFIYGCISLLCDPKIVGVFLKKRPDVPTKKQFIKWQTYFKLKILVVFQSCSFPRKEVIKKLPQSSFQTNRKLKFFKQLWLVNLCCRKAFGKWKLKEVLLSKSGASYCNAFCISHEQRVCKKRSWNRSTNHANIYFGCRLRASVSKLTIC